MKRLKLAVVGVGHLGRHHARLLAGMETVELVAVVDPNESQRLEIAKDYNAEPLADYRQLFGRVNAAVVAVPTRMHHRVGLDLLNAGIHLLIEKPLASTVAEGEELVETARRQGLTLQVGHVERFNPAWTASLTHLHEPKFIQSTRVSGFKFRSTDIGVVLDLMIHDLDLVLSIVRSPVRDVEALGISVFGKYEDAAHARLSFENGCTAVLNASRASYTAERSMQLWCPKAFAAVDFATRSIRLVRPDESILHRQFDADTLTSEAKAHLQDHLFETILPLQETTVPSSDQLTAELSDLVESVVKSRQPLVSGVQGLEALRVAERILAKIENHAWDGTADGRKGAFATRPTHIVRPPHWKHRTHTHERKQAG